MTRRKIVFTTGTRADYGILRQVMKKVMISKKLELFIIVTGTHLSKKHGFTINEIIKDNFPIYAKLNVFFRNDSPEEISKELGNKIIEFSKIFSKLKPDINIILGDRDEMFASAIAAYHMNIPNAHIHGGDISGSLDEYTRHAITKISNIHFVATQNSKKRVIKMGENPKYVFFTGSPAIDEIKLKEFSDKNELERKYNLKLTGNEILLVFHPMTTEIEKINYQITEIVKSIKKMKIKTIIIMPNSDAGNKLIWRQIEKLSNSPFVTLFSTLPRRDYLGLLQNCGILIGNSSSGIIEGSYFKIPIIDIGNRQLNRESGKYIIKIEQITEKNIIDAVKKLSRLKNKNIRNKIYGNGNASSKIIQLLENISLNKKLMQKQIRY